MAKKKQSEHARKLAAEAAARPATKAHGKRTWKLMDKGAALVAGMLAQRASILAWRTVTGKKPPTSGQHPEVTTGEAVAWAVVGGAIIELVKVGMRRSTATYWVRSTGTLPPGMKPLAKAPGANEKEPVLADPAPERASTKKKISRRSRGR
ncbi:DUF4235 domain-containing protein [Aeromicrobium sp.]|uniref:DUF4235 domain-containing protein n=1 Tax=Aeromicrobium sp. TaxID=1871063 RepID=UPI003C3BCFE8